MQFLPYLVVVAAILLFLVLPTWRQLRREEAKARKLQEEARAQGLHEPASIRPQVDLTRCFGSQACIRACPEQTVLQLIDGAAQIVHGSSCIGHGACLAACPGGAVTLVFGSETRGVHLPAVGPDFCSNVPGLYIAGELGGMGLIANAVQQGVEALGNLAADLPPRPEGGVDVVVVGAGPAGLAAALAAKARGLEYVLLEQEEFGGAIRHYPRQKIVMTRPMKLPGYRKLKLSRASKEELIAILEDVVASTGLKIDEHEGVEAVQRQRDGTFVVDTSRRELRASRVLLAVGRRGTPRRLGKPGEELDKVAYRLIDAERYQHAHLLVVGGGDSAVEAACDLAEQPGNRVTLSYRRDAISRPRRDNRRRLERAVEAGELTLLLQSEVASIAEDRVLLEQGGEEVVLPNDYVFVFAGGVLPAEFLASAGIRLETHYGARIETGADPDVPDLSPSGEAASAK
jgi:thioredoxin reductase/NAD-dependent dihydropyrimidine dehydrogenase PreA subunit